MAQDVEEVLVEAEKEIEMVAEILGKEGGERDLLALGQQFDKYGKHSELNDAQNKIKSLEELINNLEQRKKELSMNAKINKKKRRGKKKKTKGKSDPTPFSANSGSFPLNATLEKVRA